MDSFICLAWEDWQDTAECLVFSMGAAIEVYPSYNVTSARLFWESLNYKMSAWDTSLFSAGKLLGSGPLHSSFAFPGLKILETECFVLQDQTSLIQKERSWGEPQAWCQESRGRAYGEAARVRGARLGAPLWQRHFWGPCKGPKFLMSCSSLLLPWASVLCASDLFGRCKSTVRISILCSFVSHLRFLLTNAGRDRNYSLLCFCFLPCLYKRHLPSAEEFKCYSDFLKKLSLPEGGGERLLPAWDLSAMTTLLFYFYLWFPQKDFDVHHSCNRRGLLTRAQSQEQQLWWNRKPVFIFINRAWSRAEAGTSQDSWCVFNGPVPGDICCGSDSEMKDMLHKQIWEQLFFLINPKYMENGVGPLYRKNEMK